jgi:membrane protease YdiL (CAAX protease family)
MTAARPSLLAVLLLCVIGFFAGRFYAQQQDIPPALATALLPAVLLELALYLSLAFPALRERLPLPVAAASGALVYVLYSLPSGIFRPASLAVLAAGGFLAVNWFRWFGRSRLSGLAFLILLAAPLAGRLFPLLYGRPHADLRLDVLGQLFWIRLGVSTVLRTRPQPGLGFGFWPTLREWRTGAVFFLLFAPVLALASPALGFARFAPPDWPWWKLAALACGTFCGILWVVALSEEFFFRGLLQQWLEEWTGSASLALGGAALAFGAVHLGFRQFPNWPFAALAALAGVAYGLAFRQGGGIRAAMVAHALTVTLWRTLFR